MTTTLRRLLPAVTLSTVLAVAGCADGGSAPRPGSPTPAPPQSTANAYILPGAVSLGAFAFGDEPVVVYAGERLRWINADTLGHAIVADSPDATDFRKTDELRIGGEQSFVMTKLGTTTIRCVDHPNMTGTLIVRER